jgi:hypothetical protein
MVGLDQIIRAAGKCYSRRVDSGTVCGDALGFSFSALRSLRMISGTV